MNISELARRVRFPLEELRVALPELGFDIGGRAIKVDDRVAWKIIQQWSFLKKEWEKICQSRKAAEEPEAAEVVKIKKEISLPPVITVREFASRLNLPTNRVISELMKNGILASLNERIDYSTAAILSEDLGFVFKPEEKKEGEAEEIVADPIRAELESDSPEKLMPRPPVIVVMGHVDHGKTKLLDAIRKTNVMGQEAGGITQHIGAYQTSFKDKKITFIDTPGHEAFTAMRSRGARVADLAILIVAADDGVQPQTIEALKIIRAVKIPFLVAVNKIDKEGADPERVKSQLAQENVISEEWGGKIPFVPISAKKGIGIENLLETILLLGELEKDKIVANPGREGIGTIIESHLDPQEGVLATILVQNGTLARGDYLVFEKTLLGRVKSLKDWNGQLTEKAPPGMPARVLGFKNVPSVGDIIRGSKKAEGLEKVKAVFTRQEQAPAITTGDKKEKEKQFLHIILKADVQGSLEALLASLDKFQHPEVGVKIVTKEVGDIGEADVLQAEASQAIVYGFNVQANEAVLNLAQSKGVAVKVYKIIYEILDDIKAQLEAKLAPEIIRTELGKAAILKIFRHEKTYTIAGARLEEGKAVAGVKVNIFRNGASQGTGTLEELQSAKQAVQEIRMGQEFGLKISTRLPLQENDILELFQEEEKNRKLDF